MFNSQEYHALLIWVNLIMKSISLTCIVILWSINRQSINKATTIQRDCHFILYITMYKYRTLWDLWFIKIEIPYIKYIFCLYIESQWHCKNHMMTFLAFIGGGTWRLHVSLRALFQVYAGTWLEPPKILEIL